MKAKHKVLLVGLAAAAFIAVGVWYLHSTNIAVLSPKGPIAAKERNLIFFALALSLIVVVPLYSLTIAFALRYREGNEKAKYSPDLTGNKVLETVWWLIPTAIISVLGVVAWNSSHNLDPFKPLVSSNTAITVQVVAMDWKWLFIYPQQSIASVNTLEIPVNTPVDFQITSDAPMNSFWIPQLGGQIYAMPGMSTELHLLASSPGSYYGSSANISGEGFSGMNFYTKAVTQSSFNSFVNNVRKMPGSLNETTYSQLALPTQNNPPSYYSKVDGSLYANIVLKYMSPENQVGYAP